jgi:pimeloyl-ACP methyl ester carboxylesterase
MALLSSSWVEVEGVPVHARRSLGVYAEGGPVIVLVHGLVVSSRYMEGLAALLGETFEVHAPDLPGFGRSGKPRRVLDVSELADALAGYMDAVGLERASFLGNSFGCQILGALARNHPERCERLIFQGPTSDPAASSAAHELARWIDNARREPVELGRTLLADYWDAGARRALETFRAQRRDPFVLRLRGIDAPTLVICGEHDAIAPPAWGREVARRLPGGRYVEVEGGAHTLVYSHPRALEALVRAFVRDEPRARVAARPAADPEELASFDSASAVVRATGRALRGEGFPALGIEPPWEPLIGAVDALPRSLRRALYSTAGVAGASWPGALRRLDPSDLTRWVTSQYPPRRYPSVLVGASNGAAVHLALALGAPFLAQTFLVPIRHPGIPLGDLVGQMRWGARIARDFLRAHPDVQLHHMHDPNQDFLMARGMSYFRLKLRRLTSEYRRFIRERLEPGGTIVVVECEQRWPQARVGERHFFQSGAVGGLSPGDYLSADGALGAFLEGHGVDPDDYVAPAPDVDAPEAEWGFEPALLDELGDLAAREGYAVARLRFTDPEDLSPGVADLHRDWLSRASAPPTKALVESFILLEPLLAARLGYVPFWTTFSVTRSLDAAARHFRERPAFDRIDVFLFPHGIDSVGLARPAEWAELGRYARHGARLLGVDVDAFPADFAALSRYHHALLRGEWRERPLPKAMRFEEARAFLERDRERLELRDVGTA